MVMKRKAKWRVHPELREYYFRPLMSVAQRDIDVLAHLKDVVGFGTVITRYENNYRGGWAIKWYTGVLRWLVPQLLPYLVLKRRQALLVMEFIAFRDSMKHGIEMTDDEYAAFVDMYNRSRVLNQKPAQRHAGKPAQVIPIDKTG